MFSSPHSFWQQLNQRKAWAQRWICAVSIATRLWRPSRLSLPPRLDPPWRTSPLPSRNFDPDMRLVSFSAPQRLMSLLWSRCSGSAMSTNGLHWIKTHFYIFRQFWFVSCTLHFLNLPICSCFAFIPPWKYTIQGEKVSGKWTILVLKFLVQIHLCQLVNKVQLDCKRGTVTDQRKWLMFPYDVCLRSLWSKSTQAQGKVTRPLFLAQPVSTLKLSHASNN